MSRPGVRAALILVALLGTALTGCNGSPPSPPSGGGNPAVTPEQSRTDVITALHDTWRGLTPLSVTAKPANGYYSQCTDDGGYVKYAAEFRVDPKAATDPTLAGRVTPALTAAGWAMEPGSTPTGTGAVDRGTRGDITVRVFTYDAPDLRHAVLEIFGPCLQVGDADQTYLDKHDKQLPLS